MRRLLSHGDYLRRAILAGLILLFAVQGFGRMEALLGAQPLGIDFLPMWAAAREAFSHPARVYDFVALTRFQHPFLDGFRGLRPFAYPPTALLLFAPFAAAPFAIANAVWTGLGVTFILAVMSTQVKSQRLLVLLVMVLSPASVLVMLAGQNTFLIGGLAVIALLNLKDRPLLAGALMGLAGAVKPPVLVLVPLALIAIGQWRALGAAVVAGSVAVLASVLVYGVQPWFDWIAAMPRFEHLVMHARGLTSGMITPTALGLSMGLKGPELLLWRGLFGLIGAALAFFVFRRTEDPARRLAALLGGGLFVTPYAMHYDAALLAPAVAMLLAQRSTTGGWLIALAAALLLYCAAIPHWGAAAVTAVVLLVAIFGETDFVALARGALAGDDMARSPQQAA